MGQKAASGWHEKCIAFFLLLHCYYTIFVQKDSSKHKQMNIQCIYTCVHNKRNAKVFEMLVIPMAQKL